MSYEKTTLNVNIYQWDQCFGPIHIFLVFIAYCNLKIDKNKCFAVSVEYVEKGKEYGRVEAVNGDETTLKCIDIQCDLSVVLSKVAKLVTLSDIC